MPIQIVLELDGDADPIAGRLLAPSASEFRGWLALAALIESIRLAASGGTELGAGGASEPGGSSQEPPPPEVVDTGLRPRAPGT